MVGDVFVTTFDGRMFLQPGACQYVLAKSRSSSRFTVTLQYTTCAEVACTNTCIHSTHAHIQQSPLSASIYIDLISPCVQFVTSAAGVYSVSDSGVG